MSCSQSKKNILANLIIFSFVVVLDNSTTETVSNSYMNEDTAMKEVPNRETHEKDNWKGKSQKHASYLTSKKFSKKMWVGLEQT